MPNTLEARVAGALTNVRNARLDNDVISAGMVRDLVVGEDGAVSFTFVLGRDDPAALVREARRSVQELEGVTGVRINSDGAQKISAWYRGREILATSLAMLPLATYRRLPNDAGREVAGNHPLYDVLHSRPNPSQDSTECISGKILQGRHKPPHCPLFGTRCTPDHPFGATMVSSVR